MYNIALQLYGFDKKPIPISALFHRKSFAAKIIKIPSINFKNSIDNPLIRWYNF